ncbi:unnamed protein product [Mytilus edulis]|uniref:Uncharacterized protein n=1 Tax=Mytilus edulis TaxID=6550 RepID=A0A8S3SPB5_MYTED|nr:unnamed protein product [Mytilus edulis]
MFKTTDSVPTNFTIKWSNGIIHLVQDCNLNFEWTDNNPIQIKGIGIRTNSHGIWRFYSPALFSRTIIAKTSSGSRVAAISPGNHATTESSSSHAATISTGNNETTESSSGHVATISTDNNATTESSSSHAATISTDNHDTTESSSSHAATISTDNHATTESSSSHAATISTEIHATTELSDSGDLSTLSGKLITNSILSMPIRHLKSVGLLKCWLCIITEELQKMF